MNTMALNALAGVICRAQELDRTPMGIAFAIDAAGMVMSPEVAAELEHLRARVAELEAQRERRRVRLVALQNDALNMRGVLSPNGEERKVPMSFGDTLAPAVEWLVNRVAELEAERHSTNESLSAAAEQLRADRDRIAELEAVYREALAGAASLEARLAEVEQTPFSLSPETDETKALRARGAEEESADRLTRTYLPVASLREDDGYRSPLHHEYRLGHDMPETGGAPC